MADDKQLDQEKQASKQPVKTDDLPTAEPKETPSEKVAAEAPDQPEEAEEQKQEKQEIDKDWIVKGALIIFGIIGLLALAWFAIPRVLIYLTQAARPTEYSLSNSYVFGAPLSVPADGETKIRISAFLLNDEGRGVPDKVIDVQAEPIGNVSGNLQLEQVQPTTDQFGKAVFEATSVNSGQYELSAVVDGMQFPQTVTLTFR